MTTGRQAGLSGSLEPGMRLGDLLLVQRVGAGAQGEVWEARQTGVDRRVAVKVARALPGDAGAERFRREAAAAARLSHTGIVALHDLQEHDGLRLIVQEFVDGESLAAAIARRSEQGPAPDADWCRRAAEMCARLAEALQHAHEHGVVHRDVKPGNILLAPDGAPKLTDFGLASVQGSPALSLTGEILGTPWFMSPEQVLGRVADARSDVYSLGAVLYELLTLRVPHPGNDQHAVFAHILGRAPQRPRSLAPAVAPDLQAVCLKALERWPQDRYASAGELGADLERFLRGQQTRARPVGLLGWAWRGVTRASAPALAAAACLIAAGWLALERWVMAPAAIDAKGWQAARHASLAAAALGLVVPVAVLLARATRRLGRPLAVGVASVIFALLVAVGLLLSRALDQRLDRAILVAALRDSPRRALALVPPFRERWDGRLAAGDHALLALVFLSNERPDAADAHVTALSRGGGLSAVGWALETAVAIALAQDERARSATDHLVLNEETGIGAGDWTTIGDVFRAIGHRREARDAYLRAAGLQSSHELDLRLARLDAEQCLPGAEARIGEYLQKMPNDVAGRLVAIDLALGRMPIDEDAVESHINVLRRNSRRPVDALQAEYSLRTGLRRDAAAKELREQAEAVHADNPEVIDWLARTAHKERRYDDELRLYQHLVELSQGPDAGVYAVNAQVGLSAVAVSLHDYVSAEQAARAGIAADDTYFEPFVDLYIARYYSLLDGRANAQDELSAAQWSECAAILEEALNRNGLATKVLNNLAGVLGKFARATGDQAALARAMSCADRAVLLAEPDAEAACVPGAADRDLLSNALDTRSRLHEQCGEHAAAVADQEQSVSVLEAGDQNLESRKKRLDQLRAIGG